MTHLVRNLRWHQDLSNKASAIIDSIVEWVPQDPMVVSVSLDVGLGPFVETLPTSGKAGSTVRILGTNLTGATSVTFNGTPATFRVRSPSLISARVPAGASTGTVQVVTPNGTLSSNVPFRVAP